MRRGLALVLAVALGGAACARSAAPPSARTEQPPLVTTPMRERAAAEAAAERARMEDQVRRLAAEVAEQQNAIARLAAASRQQEERLDAVERRWREREESARRASPPPPPPGFAAAPPPAPALPTPAPRSLSPREVYDSAVALFKSGQSDAALLRAYELIAAHPDDPLRESAQLLAADIYYAQKDYRTALQELDALLVSVPNGAQVPEALLKMGLCRRALGDEGTARQTWERLVQDHPRSNAAARARQLLRPDRRG
jgi:TolA-binding protein